MNKFISRKLATNLLTKASVIGLTLNDSQLALYSLIVVAVVDVAYIVAQAYVDAKVAENTSVDEHLAEIRSLVEKLEG